ncbi:RNA polymerase sigma-70 factor, ECF subfamily [Quadrisphaera granulorum]|uniref:RNA polymerase sigma-70 factor (ECF subfamily) n=1 Tax=Quadrisphaera granulorum TaxID=317664 RepID=A0A316AAZ7_9ACTN|nr:sigma-70 family RNA polymerase sigma factor [Quadrisphaera granulorum]PWJ54170.1 RNA polymerase sigma-70 factor (ECF subfamily) [Quadrisphaera granulorum]SZE96309.1 RNA polymerase sigma-70 factor, ECF subfamily [Quadrisphaera granulorum]
MSRSSDPEVTFAAFYRQHYPAVLAYARRRAVEHVARDVTAEVFTTAWRRRDIAEQRGLPWLYATAALVLRNHQRSERRAAAAADRLSEHPPPAPDDHATDHAARDSVRRALAQLSDADREVLALIAWEELDVPAAARVMGCSTPTAHVRLHRARKRLRAALEQIESHEQEED